MIVYLREEIADYSRFASVKTPTSVVNQYRDFYESKAKAMGHGAIWLDPDEQQYWRICDATGEWSLCYRGTYITHWHYVLEEKWQEIRELIDETTSPWQALKNYISSFVKHDEAAIKSFIEAAIKKRVLERTKL